MTRGLPLAKNYFSDSFLVTGLPRNHLGKLLRHQLGSSQNTQTEPHI
jgi:hypothetical protein